MMVNQLRFGAIADDAFHVAIDMQRMFAEPGTFFCPDFPSIIPVVGKITALQPENTVFTRYVKPDREEMTGALWQECYRQWVSSTLGSLNSEMFDLIDPLLRFIPPANVVEKTTYSAFESNAFTELLDKRQPDTLIFTGVKTNYCVLATVLASVDKHYRTIVVTDGVAGSTAETQMAVKKNSFCTL
ncbi:isochorismatase family cysteine hydrolase [Endozoicomonas lisbonensis]|uniref:Nicotinamidase-related amidase n=1 Tax=Endozoicomonas lisbonensis TaxID=3120522 RepID=A0ABV2SEJ3_9GAMM